MADQCPNKSDIQAIFKRLKNIQANKVCFDCNAKNPTWATVTYGVFICIDCSAVHRGLGVHLTFVRSTQLDTNWTWIQLRQMQLGGNANASSFFRQHNCTTTDAQQKYTSRAAQLYRDKLHQMAIQAMRVHGTKIEITASSNTTPAAPVVHLDSTHEHTHSTEEKKEVDFFEEIETNSSLSGFSQVEPQVPQVPKLETNNGTAKPKIDDGAQPNVDFVLNADNLATGATRKPTIGNRKPAPKKGLGAKKGGLGAQRVKANFDDIEREAQFADELKARADEDAKKAAAVSAEEEEKQLASMRLAYQVLSVKQHEEEERLKKSDPKKAAQMERLGMGFASRSGITHSALTEMETIEQEGVVEGLPRSIAATSRSNYDNDFFEDSGFSFVMYKSGQGDNGNMFGANSGPTSSSNSKNIDWAVLESPKESSRSSSSRGWTDQEPRKSSISSETSSRTRDAPPADGTEAQKKFGGAKAISSEQFFHDSRDGDWERKTNLARFEGSTSISSADYFGDGRGEPSSRGNQPVMNAPDLEDVKESVRQGVTKVAGKLSNLANGVMSSIQERYGY